ncbi:hypothetical protein [Streptomyces boncukensis]|uniref:Uncharacterized protein n=1 Tax=Streptomyces boncukensis TaxID=2711219 RepID=A0A6G4WQK9_9ACTN|nr:hypothetical protein [Streptomyces boncukensis]NGO67485.1 hypothetical protein [Streptomyces boncukensis]
MTPARRTAKRTVLHALAGLEGLLLGRGQRTACRNARSAVLEDRRRARLRADAQRVLDSAREGARPAT